MAKELTTGNAYTYVVYTDSTCTVMDAATGRILKVAVAGEPNYFTAIGDAVILTDDAATMRHPVFKEAPVVITRRDGGAFLPVPGAVAVEYLEASGTQYIKTGYFGNQDTGLRSVHQQVKAGNFYVGGTRDPNDASNSALAPYWRNSAGGSTYGYKKMAYVDSTTTGWNERQIGTVNYKNGGRASTVCIGESFTVRALSESWGSQFTCPFELYIFAFNNGGSPYSGYSFKGKIFEFQVSQGEAIVRDYRPYVSPAGEAFMFDTVTGVVLKNAGTGAFRIGLATDAQVMGVLNNLQDRTGQEPGELFVRLEAAIDTEQMRTLINNIAENKNWGIVWP